MFPLFKDFLHLLLLSSPLLGLWDSDEYYVNRNSGREGVCVMGWGVGGVRPEDKVFLEVYQTPTLAAGPQ